VETLFNPAAAFPLAGNPVATKHAKYFMQMLKLTVGTFFNPVAACPVAGNPVAAKHTNFHVMHLNILYRCSTDVTFLEQVSSLYMLTYFG
jgi:hypothetical protein